ncbi:hypothetical protein KUD11_13400 [Roseovarius sp. LXJ103]|nr:hypothetical protein [Roseovarius carneus]PWE34746.1 hypothetical protein DD563_01350 [Pelagicola sp. LXJ1103]
MTFTKITTLALVGILSLSACAKPGDRVRFDGNYYPAKAKKESDDRTQFEVTVRRSDQGLNGALEAGRYEGTRYCVETFGDSTITWAPSQGPDDFAGSADGASVSLRGSCVKW